MDFIDVNIGPARKGGEVLMEWIVKTIQEVVPNIPLALDTSNIAAMEAGLRFTRARPSSTPSWPRPKDGRMMPLVKKYNAYMIGLMWGPVGMPGTNTSAACSPPKSWPRPRNTASMKKISGSTHHRAFEHSAESAHRGAGIYEDAGGHRAPGQIHLRPV